MAACINGGVKLLVGIEVGVGVLGRTGFFAVFMGFGQSFVLAHTHAPGGQSTAHGLQFCHHFEHFNQAPGPNAGDHGTMARPHLNQPLCGQLNQCFANGRTGHAVRLYQRGFIQGAAGRKVAGGDLLLDFFTQQVRNFHGASIAKGIR